MEGGREEGIDVRVFVIGMTIMCRKEGRGKSEGGVSGRR